MKRQRKLLVGCILALFGAMVLACGGANDWNKKRADEPDAEALSAELKTAKEIDLDSLLTKYNADADASDAQFKGNMLVVEGVVHESAPGNGLLTLKAKSTKLYAQCYFRTGWTDELQKIAAGKQVKVCGRCEGKVGNVAIKQCFLPDALPALLAKQEEERKAKAKREDAARKAKAEEDAKPKPTRENYARIQDGMSLDEVEAILGPGKENASGQGVQVVTWQGKGFAPTIISITFQNNRVVAKAIAP